MAKRRDKDPFSHLFVKKFMAGVWVISFVVIVISGFQSGVQVTTMVTRAALVGFVLLLITRVVVSVLSTSEEMSSGKDEAFGR